MPPTQASLRLLPNTISIEVELTTEELDWSVTEIMGRLRRLDTERPALRRNRAIAQIKLAILKCYSGYPRRSSPPRKPQQGPPRPLLEPNTYSRGCLS
jgi:hypothetical protein